MTRPNLYQSIHKGIRAMLAHLVGRASRASFGDATDMAALSADLDEVLELLEGHAATEGEHVHPLIGRASPVLLAHLAHAHEAQEATHAVLRALLAAAAKAPADQAPALGQRFVLALSRYAAEQLEHMAEEEELAMPALWNGFDDATLHAAHAAILRSIPPAKMARYLRWMLPALSPEERAELLLGMRASAPPPAFAATVDLCRVVLAPEQWDRLPDVVRAAA